MTISAATWPISTILTSEPVSMMPPKSSLSGLQLDEKSGLYSPLEARTSDGKKLISASHGLAIKMIPTHFKLQIVAEKSLMNSDATRSSHARIAAEYRKALSIATK